MLERMQPKLLLHESPSMDIILYRIRSLPAELERLHTDVRTKKQIIESMCATLQSRALQTDESFERKKIIQIEIEESKILLRYHMTFLARHVTAQIAAVRKLYTERLMHQEASERERFLYAQANEIKAILNVHASQLRVFGVEALARRVFELQHTPIGVLTRELTSARKLEADITEVRTLLLEHAEHLQSIVNRT